MTEETVDTLIDGLKSVYWQNGYLTAVKEVLRQISRGCSGKELRALLLEMTTNSDTAFKEADATRRID